MTVIHGDCIEVMQKMDADSIDLIVTSPPYNVGKEYGEGFSDSLDYDDYLLWCEQWLNECYRILVPGGRICINVNDHGRNPYCSIHSDLFFIMRSKWFRMGIIIWNKANCLSNTAWGSWESASAPGLRGQHEYILVAGKGGKKKRPRLPAATSGPYLNTDRKEFLTLTTEIWTFPPESSSEHPAPFPYELPSRCIRLFSFVGDLILDPFCGTGTTLIAARDFGRDYIGIELIQKWVTHTNERLSQKWLSGLSPIELTNS